MPRILRVNVFLFIFLLTGCSTTYHYAEFIKPSNQYIPSSIYVVGVFDRSGAMEKTCAVFTDGIPYEQIEGVPGKTAELTIENLKKLTEDMGRFKMVVIDTTVVFRNQDEFETISLTANEITDVARRYGLDAVLTLDGSEMRIRTSGNINVVTVNDESGMPVQVPEFSKESQVDLTLKWRFFDGESGQKIDEYQETYERFFGRVAYSEEDIKAFKKEDINLLDIASQAAYDYFERISPHWEEDYRIYYAGGSTELINISQELMATGNWEKAATRWKKLTTSEDLKVQHKACFNMALASELIGQPSIAEEWITKAMTLNPNSRTRNYAETIEKQQLVYRVVNSQLGLD